MRSLLFVPFALAALPAIAQQAEPAVEPLVCTVSAASEFIRIAVCDESGPDAAMAAFGRIACKGALPCGVWFWTDAAAAPSVAPANHDGLSQAEVTSSLGVFVAEEDMVVRIEAATE